VGGQVDVGEPLEVQGVGLVVVLSPVAVQEIGDLGFETSDVIAGRKQQIGGIVVAAPVLELALSVHLLERSQGADDLEMEVRVGGGGPDDARDLGIDAVLELEGLAERVLVAEILPGRSLRDHEREGIAEGRIGIARKQLEGKHGEDVLLGENDVFLHEVLVFVAAQHAARALYAHRFLDIGKVVEEQGGDGRRYVAEMEARGAVLVEPLPRDTVYAVGIFMVAVIAQLVPDIEEDQDAAGHADGQSQQVDEGKALVFVQVAQCGYEVIPEHRDALQKCLAFNHYTIELTYGGHQRFT